MEKILMLWKVMGDAIYVSISVVLPILIFVALSDVPEICASIRERAKKPKIEPKKGQRPRGMSSSLDDSGDFMNSSFETTLNESYSKILEKSGQILLNETKGNSPPTAARGPRKRKTLDPNKVSPHIKSIPPSQTGKGGKNKKESKDVSLNESYDLGEAEKQVGSHCLSIFVSDF